MWDVLLHQRKLIKNWKVYNYLSKMNVSIISILTALFVFRTGNENLLQYSSGVTDAPGISRCLNSLLLSSPYPCFITVFLLICYCCPWRHINNLEDLNASRQPINLCKQRGKMRVKVEYPENRFKPSSYFNWQSKDLTSIVISFGLCLALFNF